MEIIIRSVIEEKNVFIEVINNPTIISIISIILGMWSTVLLSKYEDKKKSRYVINEFVIKELYQEYLFIRKRKSSHPDNFLTYERCQKISKIIADQLHNVINLKCKSLKQDLIKLLKLSTSYDEKNNIEIFELLEKIVNKIN